MIEHKALAALDQHAASLRDYLSLFSGEKLAAWLNRLEADLDDPNHTVEYRISVNAVLVGILTVLCDERRAANGEVGG